MSQVGELMDSTRVHKRVEGQLVGSERRAYFRALLDQLRAIEQMEADGAFERGVWRIGAEQEIFLVDRGYYPAPAALQLLDVVKDRGSYTTELGLFNLEMNALPRSFGETGLSEMETELDRLFDQVVDAGRELGVKPVLTGILPTLEKADLGLENMVPSPRYRALNQAMMAVRGDTFDFSIRGLDDLTIKHDSVMVEACNASFQVHLQLADPDRFAHFYNLSQLLLAPVLAAGTNSPVLFGRRLWAETRIALFEQSCDVRTAGSLQRDAPGRVSFGRDWLSGTLVDVYRDNVARFRPLVGGLQPELDGTEALARGVVPPLNALRLHNGTIYRWNRPCYGISENGKPHLRIEFRVLPAGPTVADEVANAAFWLGLMRELGETIDDIPARMNHDDARRNLYAAARDGLRARLSWLDGEDVLAQPLILDHLLPLADKGLERAGIVEADRKRYIGILEQRVRSLQTGTSWAWRSWAQMHQYGRRGAGKRATALTAAMVARQRTGTPVGEWTLADYDDNTLVEGAFEKVSELMETDIVTVGPDDPIELVSELMGWTRVRYLPVENDRGELVGMVSYRAVLRYLNETSHQTDGAESYTVPVSEIMRRELVTVTPHTPTREAIELMRTHRVGALPVVQGPHVVAILTQEELINLASRAIEISISSPPAPSSEDIPSQ